MAAGRHRRAPRARPAPVDAASSRSTPAARTRAPTCSLDAFDEVVTADRPRRRTPRRCGSVSSSSPAAATAPSGSGSCTTTATRARRAGARCWPRPPPTPSADVLGPKLREWPSLQAPARGRRHDLRHRPARDRARARRVRPGPARRGARGARGQHRRHAGPPPGARRARRLRRQPADLRQRHRLRLARRARPGTGPSSCRRRSSSTPRPRTAALRRTPLTGRHTHYQERRAALFTLLANAPGRGAAVAGRPAVLRHAAADGRLPRRPLGRARRSTTSRRCSRSTSAPARSWRRAASATRPRRATHDAAGRCSRRGGCPTGTGSTSSATSPPPPPTRPQDVADRRRGRRRTRPAPVPIRRAGRVVDEDDGSPRTPGSSRGSSPTRWPSRSALFVVLVAVRRPRGLRPRHRRRPRRRRRTTPRDLLAAVDRVVAPARHGHRRPGAGVRRCRWRCWARCSAAAPPPPSRPSCCSPCRSRSGAPGGCCASSAAWSTPAARRAGWSRSVPSPTPWSRSPPARSATAGSASSPSR